MDGRKVAPSKEWKASLRYNWEKRGWKKEGLEGRSGGGGNHARDQGPGTSIHHIHRATQWRTLN